MRRVLAGAVLAGADPDVVFARICDFGAYADHTPTVRAVRVTPTGATTSISEWSVAFRSGQLHWTEADTIDAAARTVTFTQLHGDLDAFAGVWRVWPHADGARVDFTAEFDLGMPTMDAMIGPIAEEALRESVTDILHGLFGAHVAVGSQAVGDRVGAVDR